MVNAISIQYVYFIGFYGRQSRFVGNIAWILGKEHANDLTVIPDFRRAVRKAAGWFSARYTGVPAASAMQRRAPNAMIVSAAGHYLQAAGKEAAVQRLISLTRNSVTVLPFSVTTTG